LLKGKLSNEEKLRYAAEESNSSLQKQLHDLKESTQQQITFIKQQYKKGENSLKEQLKENTKTYETKLNQLELERKNEVQILNAQIDKLKSNYHIVEKQLYDKNSALEKSTEEHSKLSKENDKILNKLENF